MRKNADSELDLRRTVEADGVATGVFPQASANALVDGPKLKPPQHLSLRLH